jgi:regulation of enolase protein 1 (concanavalin A-like superfamily)
MGGWINETYPMPFEVMAYRGPLAFTASGANATATARLRQLGIQGPRLSGDFGLTRLDAVTLEGSQVVLLDHDQHTRSFAVADSYLRSGASWSTVLVIDGLTSTIRVLRLGHMNLHAGPALGLTLSLTVSAGLLRGAPPAPEPRSGFFRVEQRDGRWWLIDPDSQPFLSKGVCHITYRGDTIKDTRRSPYGEATQAKYGSEEKWREAAAGRLMEWGFNSLGAWSDEKLSEVRISGRGLANAPIVDFGEGFVASAGKGAQAWLQGVFPDVFDPGFETFCRRRARERCAPRKDDRTILGWFTDNELRWGPDWRGNDELLTMFLNLPAEAPGRTAAVQLLRERYPDIARFNTIWKTNIASWDELERAAKVVAPVTRKALYSQNEGEERQANDADPNRAAFVADCEAFVAQLAERYFSVTREALRAADPNHLNFGCRFAYLPPAPARAAAGRYLDVISFNCYQTDPTATVRQYAALGRPLIIGEFTFRGEDVGLPNTRGAGPKVAAQADRAAAFERYVRLILNEPAVVGYHWFQHSDQPKEGRFDGENSNYGVVNGQDETYVELTRKMTEVNRLAESWHRGTGAADFRDHFRGRLAEGWSWIREDPKAWRVSESGLEVRIQPGNMWGPPNNARNVLVRLAPDPSRQEVIVSVTLTNQPTEQYEQVDLVWYYDDGHMVKLGQELVDGKLSIVMGREENDRTRTIAILPLDSFAVQLRQTVNGNNIRGEFRTSDSGEWKLAGICDLPGNGTPKVSLQCYQGPATAEHWARLNDLRIECRKP